MARANDVTIRDASPGELDDVATLTLESYAEYGAAPDDAPEIHAAWRQYREELRDVRGRAADGAAVIVAEKGERIVGTVTYYRPGTSGEDWPPDVAVIRLLAVPPDMRASGLGRVLTEECVRRARAAGVRAVGLHTTTMMATAKAMYERMGFVRVPEHDFSPAPGLLVMGYRLAL